MCGIAGLYLVENTENNNQFNKNKELIVNKCIKFLKHRGPDHSGVYYDENELLSLVHTRLSIIDTSLAGHQPMLSESNKECIAFNGEIYNFQSLREELNEKETINWSGKSDTEVLLNLYRYHRSDIKGFLEKLNGIFSIAIWDKREEKLILARDPLGVKPLYYLSTNNGFVFSSEIKSLLKISPIIINSSELELDEIAINRYLTYLYCPGNRTPIKDIKKIDPGTFIIIKKGFLEENNTYYNLPFNRKKVYLRDKSKTITELQYHLKKAVQRQLISDVPLGSFLSGGLDSSAIVAFAKEQIPDIRCFTIDNSNVDFEGFERDLPYAQKVANHLKVPLEIVKVNSQDMINGLVKMIWQLDEPLADPAALNVLFISRLAKKLGIKVLLSGAGGDDIFTGYRRHYALNKEYLWDWMPKMLKIYLKNLSSNFDVNKPFVRRARKLFSAAHLDENERLVKYLNWINRNDLEKIYTEKFRKAIFRERSDEIMINYLNQFPRDLEKMNKMLALEQRFFLTDHNLNYTDKMSMQYGVEVRVPFLDIELVNFASTIDPNLKQRGRHGKWILKKAMEPFLPKEIIYRSKSGFGAPIRTWLQDELKDWIEGIIMSDSLKKRGIFNIKSLHDLIKANSNKEIDASYTILSIACIEIWCRHFIDNSGDYIYN